MSYGKFTPETYDPCFLARKRARFDILIIIHDENIGDNATFAQCAAFKPKSRGT